MAYSNTDVNAINSLIDNYLQDVPDYDDYEEEFSVKCCDCGCEIDEGDECYRIDDDIFCEDCIEHFRVVVSKDIKRPYLISRNILERRLGV